MLSIVTLLGRQEPLRKVFPILRSFSTVFRQQPGSLEADIDSLDSMLVMSLNPWYDILGFCNSMPFLKTIHCQLTVHGLTRNLLFATKLLSLYGSLGDTGQARLLFDGIENPDLYCWKVMLRWYFLNDSYLEVIGFYRCMRQCINEQDNVIFSVILKASAELSDLNEGKKLHCQVVKLGSPDGFVLTGLLDMYAKCGRMEFSRCVFDEILEKDVVSWTSMIAAYVKNGCAEEGLILFNEMRRLSIEPNEVTVGSLLNACLKLDALHQGKWVHSYLLKKGFFLDSLLGTALLDMYVKCGDIADAHSVFDELPARDLVSWTAMIVGYAQRNHPDRALELFTNKKWKDLMPNCVTIASVLSACAQSKKLEVGRALHLLALQLGLTEDSTVKNALIDMYAKCGRIEDASIIFKGNKHEDVIAWNTMIGGYAQNGFGYEALELFHGMRSSPTLPDAVSLVNVISACSLIGALQINTSIHAHVIKIGFLSNVYVATALLNLYAKCGEVGSARRVFDEMCKKTMVTWSAMVGGYGMQGDPQNSLALLNDMLKGNVQFNDVIFTNILAACSHTGMVDEGFTCFYSMCAAYNIAPRMKHYVCMVDLLARAGRLDDALDFVRRMPVKPDVSVWGALLHGCRIHSRLELGEVAVKRMLELYPDSPGYYVLISNFYASDGRWDQVAKVRDLLKKRGLIKSPGCSAIETDSIPYSLEWAVAS